MKKRPGLPQLSGWGTRLLVAAFAGLTALLSSDLPGPLQGVQAAAHPHRFNLLVWETSHLLSFPPRKAPEGGEDLVDRYFQLARELQQAQMTSARGLARPGITDGDAMGGSLVQQQTAQEIARLQPAVQRELQAQVASILRAEGFTLRLLKLDSVVFPPVAFTLEQMPRVLIVSPRDRIAVLDLIHLRQDISEEEIAALERALEQQGRSALVEPLGGLSTYPSVVALVPNEDWVLATIAHEWAHHYLFLRPLGQRYSEGGEMASINETVANMVGDEVVARLSGRMPAHLRPLAAPSETPAPTGPGEEVFDFRAFMQETRLETEGLLREGQVDQAESYMEERRLGIQRHGVFIRKLNQAYFAFHGTYADSPASVSRMYEQLVAFRRAQPSLGEFLRVVGEVRSPTELAALIEGGSSP